MALQLKKELKYFVNQSISSYGKQIHSLVYDLKDGVILLHILHHFDSNCVDISNLNPENVEENLTLAINTAQKRFGIWPLMDPEDFMYAKPDIKQVVTYLSAWRDTLDKSNGPTTVALKRKSTPNPSTVRKANLSTKPTNLKNKRKSTPNPLTIKKSK